MAHRLDAGAVDVGEDGREVRRCMDGKQRLTAIKKFMEGQVSILVLYLLSQSLNELCRFLVRGDPSYRR